MASGVKVDFKLNTAVLDQISNGAVRRAGAIALRRAQQAAPVASGRYRDSLRAEYTRTSAGWTCSIIADVPYATSIEFRQRAVLGGVLRSLSPRDFAP